MPKERSGLWRDRDFLLLWAGQTASEMGSAVTKLAVPLAAVVALDATALEVGLITAATSIAFVVIALPVGALVDRRSKRGIMIVCDAARLVIIVSVPVTWYMGLLTMAQLYIVAIAVGVCTVFFDVSYQSYLPSLLGQKYLMEGNGKLGITQEFAEFAGPGLGGGLVGTVGAAGALIADSLSYAVSFASLFGIRHRETCEHPTRSSGRARPSLRAEIGEGLRFVTGHPILCKVVICNGTVNLFKSMATALQIIFLVQVLHVPPAYTGLLFALASLGGIAGGALSARMARWLGSARIMWFSLLVFGMPQVLVVFAEPGWSIALFPIGFGISYFAIVVYNVAVVTFRQLVCPAELQGRMAAVIRWIGWSTIPLGAVLGGLLGTVIGVRSTLWIACVGTWAAGFWLYFSPLRWARDVPVAIVDRSPSGGDHVDDVTHGGKRFRCGERFDGTE